jgi:hypothetical protein
MDKTFRPAGCIFLTLVCLALGMTVFAASPPGLVNYQGVLRSLAGAPLTGNQNMVFTFYSAASGGDQILLDSHTTSDGNPVSVSNGLFTTLLGGGVLADGSGAGTYTALAEVFRDYGTVYMAIKVGAEVLSPRVQVVSSAYSLNADNLDGLDSASFSLSGHTHVNDHVRLHTLSSTSDHSATNWRTFYSDGSGQITELALGSSGQILKSNGASAPPTWQADNNTTYTASNGVLLSGTDFQHTDTSSQASSNNSNAFLIQDITLDGFGHLTGLATADMDPRFVNVTGDTMTGPLQINTSSAWQSLNAQSTYGGDWNNEAIRGWSTGSGTATSTNLGVYGLAQNSVNINVGIQGLGTGDVGIKRGVEGAAQNAGINYGGYFWAGGGACGDQELRHLRHSQRRDG